MFAHCSSFIQFRLLSKNNAKECAQNEKKKETKEKSRARKTVAIIHSRRYKRTTEQINCYDIINVRSVIETSLQTFDVDDYQAR